MKFSKYVMLAGAAALMTACSSEEPANGGQQNAASGDEMYFAINVIGNQTRADGAELAGESDIQRLQIFILDQDENLYFEKTVEAEKIDANGMATFGVTSVTYNEMLGRVNDGTQMKIMVYANGTGSLDNSEDLLHGVTSNPTWKTSDNVGFVMSNAAEVLTTFKDPGDSKGTAEDPWVIAEPIELARLATRFEYSNENKDTKALHESGLTMSVTGFDVVTFATTTYRIPQFSADGKMPATLTSTNHCHFEPTAELPYRVTQDVTSDDNRLLRQYNYNLTKDNAYVYERPNTVPTSFTQFAAKAAYKTVPFAAVKAEFKCTNFAGTGNPSASMAAKKEVYAINGIFIGGFEDFKMLREAGLKFKINYTETATVKFSQAEKSMIEKIENNYNRLLDMALPTDYNKEGDNAATEADDIAWFKQNLGDLDIYTTTDGHYYTYYAHLILNDKDASSNYWKYGVSRNTSYALTVNSFKYLGNSGGGRPGDGPTAAELDDAALQFSVTVKPWTLNVGNKWDL